MFYSLIVIRQAKWNTTLQKHTDIILQSTILCYPHKVSLYSGICETLYPQHLCMLFMRMSGHNYSRTLWAVVNINKIWHGHNYSRTLWAVVNINKI